MIKFYKCLQIKNYFILSTKQNNYIFKDHLKNAALKCDEESERIAEQFLAGDMDCDKFLQVYVKSRTVSFYD